MTTDNVSEISKATVLVLGDGGWGTALAMTLETAGHCVRLWSYDEDYARELAETRQNQKFLPGVKIPGGVRISADAAELSQGVDALLSVIPTRYLRGVLGQIRSNLPRDLLVVSCTKGIERERLRFPSEVLREELNTERVVVLSGPSHAEEVARRLPTTVVAAAAKQSDSRLVQGLFSRTRLRVYTSRDLRGVELGGAVKNIIAIAAGISDGLGFGDNTRAAIVTRGAVEITRLGLALGARKETFSGLSCMGDLITTCTSPHSRNRTVGFRIGRGEKLEDILASTPAVAEGVGTAQSGCQLASKLKVDMPITREVHAVLYEAKQPGQAVEDLLARTLKEEIEDLV